MCHTNDKARQCTHVHVSGDVSGCRGGEHSGFTGLHTKTASLERTGGAAIINEASVLRNVREHTMSSDITHGY